MQATKAFSKMKVGDSRLFNYDEHLRFKFVKTSATNMQISAELKKHDLDNAKGTRH